MWPKVCVLLVVSQQVSSGATGRLLFHGRGPILAAPRCTCRCAAHQGQPAGGSRYMLKWPAQLCLHRSFPASELRALNSPFVHTQEREDVPSLHLT
jgi:hypothetical protein